MAIKRKHKLAPEFSMASMTDIIFLLLIFFMISSTLVTPNAVKVSLPQSSQQSAEKPMARLTIDKQLQYYVAYGSQKERSVAFDEIVPFLQSVRAQDGDMVVALYADETIPYAEVIRMMDLVNRNELKMILVTRTK